MPIPATSGVLRTKIADMKVGDYAKVTVDGTALGLSNYLRDFGTSTQTEIPLAGHSSNAIGSAYFVKVDKGLLVCDRVVRNTIAWDILNSSKLIQGMTITLDGISGIIRSLTGGVAYADANGNSSTTDQSKGAFPTSNEWDRYIVNSTLDGKITAGDDNVWHWSGINTWCQDTPSVSIIASTNRTWRGNTALNRYSYQVSSTSNTAHGFRPVFEYKES